MQSHDTNWPIKTNRKTYPLPSMVYMVYDGKIARVESECLCQIDAI